MEELLLVNVEGVRFGIWKRDIASIKELKDIHQLPLTPACFAGVSDMDGDTVILFDLAVCIGLPPLTGDGTARLLLFSRGAKPAGFAVEGEIEHLRVSPDAVVPVPRYLSAPAIRDCVVHEGEAVPVVDISFIYDNVKQGRGSPESVLFISGDADPGDAFSVKDVRLFRVGGDIFAVSASSVEAVSEIPDRIVRLPLASRHIEGIVYHNGCIMPVIKLSRRMKVSSGKEEGLMLVSNVGDARFGLLVDSDEGMLSDEDFRVRPLPPLVRSGWMKSAVLRGGEIIPLVLLHPLMTGLSDEKPLHRRYTPRSKFHLFYGKKPVKVVEFMLNGMRYGLPASQVKDTVGFQPYRRIPNVEPVAVGVTEYAGELLPVVDLGVWFGWSSRAHSGQEMVLIKNGDFQALLMAEEVFEVKDLPTDMHRALPFRLMHRYVYWCYPDESVVKLVLNVETLTVRFEKSLVKDFHSMMSKGGLEDSGGAIPILPDNVGPIQDDIREYVEEEVPHEDVTETPVVGEEAFSAGSVEAEKTSEPLTIERTDEGHYPDGPDRKREPDDHGASTPAEEIVEETTMREQSLVLDDGKAEAAAGPHEGSPEDDAMSAEANIPGQTIEAEGLTDDEYIENREALDIRESEVEGDIPGEPKREPDDQGVSTPEEEPVEETMREKSLVLDDSPAETDAGPHEGGPEDEAMSAEANIPDQPIETEGLTDRENIENREAMDIRESEVESDIPDEPEQEPDDHGANTPAEEIVEETMREKSLVLDDSPAEADAGPDESSPEEDAISEEVNIPDQTIKTEGLTDNKYIEEKDVEEKTLDRIRADVGEEQYRIEPEGHNREGSQCESTHDTVNGIHGPEEQAPMRDGDEESCPAEPSEMEKIGEPNNVAGIDEHHEFSVDARGREDVSDIHMSADYQSAVEDISVKEPEGVSITDETGEKGPHSEETKWLSDNKRPEYTDIDPDRRRKRRFFFASIFAALLAILFLFRFFIGKESEIAVFPEKGKNVPAVTEETVSVTEEFHAEEKARASNPLAERETKPVPSTDYVVKEGDTLWDISERYTGDPFEYHRIARENEIRDPDVIWPEQTIAVTGIKVKK